ncbi:MAG: DNA methylase [Selenomonas sp.]|uniref:Y-family DNA polymerase n=1 Tax=Selenomonas sp. TaxID=2053611 RepID=UPI0025CE1B95|nr:DNA methylase [Selenomonas sp.]MCR5440076.1 DNA methylase [Selenomonas sp.]
MTAPSYFVAIDLKSFYASVECRDRELDPLDTNLVVADASRTNKTICLAVSPSLKAYGIPGRARLFEVVQAVAHANQKRLAFAPRHRFCGKTAKASDLATHPELAIDYHTAVPRMARYLEVSTQIYQIYLRYIAPEDIHVYSIDEVFLDVTHYLKTYQLTARELTQKLIDEVYAETGITATAGIAPNLYLCKVAMDIVAKHLPADDNGVRIAEIDEKRYRQLLWNHRPLTDFWRVGRGYAKKLEQHGLYTMGDIARCSLGKATDFHNEELLYRLFGVNAELLIDHAWGYEPCTMAAIKAYKPAATSIGSGQVLQSPYPYDKAALVAWEMTDLLVLELVDKKLLTSQLILDVGYDIENTRKNYRGPLHRDHYGRMVPKPVHGSRQFATPTASSALLLKTVQELFAAIVDKDLLVRRLTITFGDTISQAAYQTAPPPAELDLFAEPEKPELNQSTVKEASIQQTIVALKKRFGKNAILKGANLQEGATTISRNNQIGGHRA